MLLIDGDSRKPYQAALGDIAKIRHDMPFYGEKNVKIKVDRIS